MSIHNTKRTRHLREQARAVADYEGVDMQHRTIIATLTATVLAFSLAGCSTPSDAASAAAPTGASAVNWSTTSAPPSESATADNAAGIRQLASIVAEEGGAIKEDLDKLEYCIVPASSLEALTCTTNLQLKTTQAQVLVKRLTEAGEPPAEVADLVTSTISMARTAGDSEIQECVDVETDDLSKWSDVCTGPSFQARMKIDDLMDKLKAWEPYI